MSVIPSSLDTAQLNKLVHELVSENGHSHTSKLSISRVFTKPDVHPYAEVEWEIREALIAYGDKIAFQQKDVEFPNFWSQTATNIVADKYFKGREDLGKKEKSVKQLIYRIVNWYESTGVKDHYFNSKEDARAFADELTYLVLHQYMAWNSPVFFNVGINNSPRVSACFIVDVEDNMESILDWYKVEGLIFKEGSGSGVNLSKLRSSHEQLSGGGYASGPVSFMRGADASAGTIKSGGRTRRAAKLIVLDDCHPDIEEFINCKVHEEKKARALKKTGFDVGVNGKDSYSLQYQNANNSVSCSDKFFEAYITDSDWELKAVKDGRVIKKLKAKDLMRQIAQAAHECADPGVFYIDTMKKWHTSPGLSERLATNPCQPGFATVLTPQGIRTFDDINIGDWIWSGKQWTKIINKLSTGIKSVYSYETSFGRFIGTEDHQIMLNGERIKVKDTDELEITKGPDVTEIQDILDQDVVDGWVLGDGTVHKASGDLVLLCLGKKDNEFHQKLKEYVIRHRPGINYTHWEVKTTIQAEELPRTYKRIVPQRFYKGNSRKVRGFLKGLYSANGSICNDRITLKAASRELICQVREMLSGLGIPSYITTNRAKEVKFPNGIYLCKESYDLNIVAGKSKFIQLIGFVQEDKKIRAERITGKQAKPWKGKVCEIQNRKFLGEMPVYDITVEVDEHTYWTGGVLVSNCGEFVRPAWTSCNLASIRLTKFRKPDDSFDIKKFTHVVELLLTSMDISIHNAEYPIDKIRDTVLNYRELGLGYTDLGALLMQMGVAYDSEEGRNLAAALTSLMSGAAWRQSARLAQTASPYPGWQIKENKEAHLRVMEQHLNALNKLWTKMSDEEDDNEYLVHAALALWQEAIELGKKHGFRNAQTTLLAPCGTISFIMDADTTGVEPELALIKYKKLVGGGTLKIVNQSVTISLKGLGYSDKDINNILKYIEEHGSVKNCSLMEDFHKPVFACAMGDHTIHYMGHIKMLAAVIPFICGSCSKTVNAPEETTVEEIEQIYLEGWKLGLKNIAIYRDNCKAEQVLNVKEKDKKEISAPKPVERRRLPKQRRGKTTSFQVDGCEGYIQTGEYTDGQLGEIFLKISKTGSTLSGAMDMFAIAVSLGLQHGVPLETFIEKYTNLRFAPAGMTDDPDFRFATSLGDYIAKRLALDYLSEEVRTKLGIRTVSERTEELDSITKVDEITNKRSDSPICSKCGILMRPAGSCFTCESCGSTSGCS